MSAERFEQRPDPTATDERHHDMDLVSRFDLRSQLTPQGWLARRVCQQSCVEQRDERYVQGRGDAVGPSPQDGVEDGSWVHQLSTRVRFNEFAKPIQQG